MRILNIEIHEPKQDDPDQATVLIIRDRKAQTYLGRFAMPASDVAIVAVCQAIQVAAAGFMDSDLIFKPNDKPKEDATENKG